jgi:HAE1 family hydrophobic/amphiphilic exporter-1
VFLSDLSIKRPVFAAVAMLVLVTVGLFSYRRLALDFFPNIEIPVLLVTTRYPGASPEALEREVSKRIEDAVNTIPGIKHVSSTSVEGSSLVVAEFQLEVKINDAAQDARAKIAAIRRDLPQGIDEPVIQKIDFGAMPVVSLAVRSDRLSPRELSTIVEKRVKKRLENVSGVGKVELVGLSKREVAVEVDPLRLEAIGMGVDEVIAGLQAQNVNTPLGRLTQAGTEYPLRVAGKPAAVEGYRDLVVARRGGRPIPLAEVAAVRDGIEEQRTLAFVDGVPAVGIDIQKQSGVNTVEVVDHVIAVVAGLRTELPEGTQLTVVRDASEFIRESVADVRDSLVEGAILTIFIVFLFLNSWRSTVITGLTLPISIISAFISIYFLGMTLNVITLMALSLAVGLLIDDAIVVRENIVRHLEHGQDHFAAAREGTAEIGLAVLATTLSIVAVFVPVAFMKGVIGRVFYSFGLTVTFAVLVSLFVSFSLDPMLSSRWVDPDVGRAGRRSALARALDGFNRLFERLADGYRGGIGRALDHPVLVLLIAAGAFVGGLAVMGTLESNFMQPQDRSEFQLTFKTAPTASIAETRDRLGAVLGVLKAVPEIDHTYATIGANETTVRDASIYVHLLPLGRRTRSQFAIMRELRRRLHDVPGIRPSFGEAGSMNGGQKPLLINLRGEDLTVLRASAAELKARLAAIPGVVDLEVSPEEETPEFRLVVDQERAVATGVGTDALVRSLGALVGGQAVTTFEDEDGDAVNLRVRLPHGLREDASQVERLRLAVRGADGTTALVPVGEVASYRLANTPAVINRRDLARQVVLSANVDGVAVGTALAAAQKTAAEMKFPPGYGVAYSGDAEMMVESFRYLAEALLLAVIFVYLILAAQFESFIDPFAIMFSLPLSLVGMAGMLFATRDTISIMSLIGLIMLMGLVTKNAILLVDYAKTLQGRGLARREALIEAGRTRLRPILMTTLAMIFGMLPLALGIGAGSEMRAPMGRAVIGGLLTSTLLTLFVVPVAYELLDDFGAWAKRRWTGTHPGGHA